MLEINGISLPFIPAGGVDSLQRRGNDFDKQVKQSSFDEALSSEVFKLKFSDNAKQKLNLNGISLSYNDAFRLEKAINMAAENKAQDSLILLDKNAFIVNVANRMVTDVINTEQAGENIISNIDSALIA